MEKKLRGRPLKRDEDKLIGRRISMVKAAWDAVDSLCEDNSVTLEGVIHAGCSALVMKGHNPNQNQ